MKILAIESSCDDTAAAVVENGSKILSSKISSQIKDHRIYGGVVPEVASRRHIESIAPLVKEVMAEASLCFGDLDAVAVTYAPGLVGSLLVGVNFAKGISMAQQLPLIPVHHIKAHVASVYLTNPDLIPPFLCLVVSGGHSHILEVKSHTEFGIIGKTRDDAAGEAFDKVGRRLGFSYPAGAELDKIANSGDEVSFKLPVPLYGDESTYDFSFSGLKTAMINIINNFTQRNEPLPVENLSASFRKAVISHLVSGFIKSAQNYGYNTLAIAGGVSANSLLRSSIEKECKKRDFKFFKPDIKYCGDNAAMVGAQAYYEFAAGKQSGLDLNARASMPVDAD